MMQTLEYKGYKGSIKFTVEDNCFWGEVLGVSGSNSYEGNNIKQLEIRFQEAIDCYLEWCEEDGIEPETPVYNELFIDNIPTNVYLHISQIASQTQKTIDEAARDILEAYVNAN